MLALGHEIERRVKAGELEDLSHAARVLGLTRARATQVANLTLLAPRIQEQILATAPVGVSRNITERTVRPTIAESVWSSQRSKWSRL
jgi:hypothetical protein